MELSSVGINSKNGAAYSSNEQGKASNGDKAAERDGLLSHQLCSDVRPSSNAADVNLGMNSPLPRDSVVSRKRIIIVFIIFLLLLIIALILISMALCAALHEDEDEKFNASLFTLPRSFNGSFEMPNLFIEDSFTLESNAGRKLAEELQDKLADHYASSSALARYFHQAEIFAFRNGSVHYGLTFLLPEEEESELRKFVVSREMVYNVFRQLLVDQETARSEEAYIEPASLTMFSTH